MAAKPPKPPGNFLKSLLNHHNNNKNQQQLQHQYNNEDDDIEGNSSEQLLTGSTAINFPDCNTIKTIPITEATKKINCNCSNISIMHLFHEMKQEFPTIPDTIVAQCVNENCHQRENCIQMLRNELELNPVPAQSYPAKVLHPPNNNIQNSCNNNTTTTANNFQKPPLLQKPVVLQQKPPLKPIKPIRTAPLHPPTNQQQTNNKNSNNTTKINSTLSKNTITTTTTNKQFVDENLSKNNGLLEIGGVGDPTNSTLPYKQSIPTTTTVNSTTTSEVNNNDNMCATVGGDGESVERNLPRQRPTTLNLNTQLHKQQQQQRQRLNVQLQQRFEEQRNKQRQQQQQQQQQQPQNNAIISKPLRKAPQPPIAPKPTQYQINHINANVANSFLNDSLLTGRTATSPLSESEISVSVSLSTPSPASASSPNNTTHHHHHHHHNHPFNNTPTPPPPPLPPLTANQNQQHQHLQTKSPIRHRSVITLQPEPPYTRDFFYTPVSSTSTSPSLAAPPTTTTTIQTTATNSSSSATSSPTTSVAGSQKSFTSVNLTLRPPVSPTGANSALQPSTIDITAGPGFSGASGGGKSLHYSSTSYDARLGYQQNFQITVTDEGGVFSACRLRPQQQKQQHCLNQQQQLQLQQQFHNNNVVALQQNIQNCIQSPQGIGGVNTSSGFGSGGVISGNINGNMCLPPQQTMDDTSQEILKRQKKKRDKLAAALREYKKRLGNVEQEINLLTGTIPTEGLSERLDEEIAKLMRDCEYMLRSSNNITQPTLTQQELSINYQPHQQQPQPFPRQKIPRAPPRPPPPPRQTSLDIIQHHSQSPTSHTPPTVVSLPNLNVNNIPQQHQHTNSFNLPTPPSYYSQQSTPLTAFSSNSHDMYADPDDPVIDDDVDGEEYEEVTEEHWECSMCTFRNHPQLNICETCDNVRIIPEPVLSREDIHITLSPGENRIIHSWIVS